MRYAIHFDLLCLDISAMSAKQVLQHLAKDCAAYISCDEHELLSALLLRERNAPSGIGGGVAIPHLQLPGLKERFVCLVTLQHPAEFGAADDQPADIVCLLLSPEAHGNIHLRGLSRITRMLQNPQLQKRLREAEDEQVMRAFLTDPDGWLLAA